MGCGGCGRGVGGWGMEMGGERWQGVVGMGGGRVRGDRFVVTKWKMDAGGWRVTDGG